MSQSSHAAFRSTSESLPPGWTMSPIGDVVVKKVKQEEPVGTDTFRYVDIGSIDNVGKVITEAKQLPITAAPSRARQKVAVGDVLVSMTRPNLNAVAIVPPELDGATASTGFDVLRPTHAVLTEWLFLHVRSQRFVGAMTALVQGALYPAVRPSDIRNFSIPLPPLPEQRRIVARLEALGARSRRARENLTAVPAQLAEARQSLLAAAFRGDFTFSKSAATKWPKTTLGALIKKGAFCTDGDWIESVDQDPSGEVRLIQLADIGEEGFRDKSSRFLTEAKALELGCTKLEEGDLLIARMAAPLGRTCIFPGSARSCVTVVDVCVFRVGSSGVSNEWLAHCLNAPQARDAMLAHASGTTRGRISRSNLLTVELPFPPLHTQHEIVLYLRAAFARLDATASAHAAAVAVLDRLDQSLLARALSGGLVASGITPKTITPVPTASVIAQTYLLRFIPALLRTAGHPVSLGDLNQAVALRFLPAAELLPVMERLGGARARAHFAASPLIYEDGAFLAAMRLLRRTGAIAVAKDRRGVQRLSVGPTPPPGTPGIDADAHHLVPLLARIPAESVAPVFRRLQSVEVQEALLTTP